MFRFLKRKSDHEEVQKALVGADKSLEEIKTRSKEVSDVSSRLRYIRERNHFAEQLSIIMMSNK